MFESIEPPFPQRREEASNSRHTPVGGEGRPPQCKFTLVTGHTSLGPGINAVILFSSGRTVADRGVSLKSTGCQPSYAVDKPRTPSLDQTDRNTT